MVQRRLASWRRVQAAWQIWVQILSRQYSSCVVLGSCLASQVFSVFTFNTGVTMSPSGRE